MGMNGLWRTIFIIYIYTDSVIILLAAEEIEVVEWHYDKNIIDYEVHGPV